jgi:hypothetical protein
MVGRHLLRLLLSLLALSMLFVASTTSALAAPPTTETVTEKGVTETFYDPVGVCGVTGQVTITYNAVFHITEFADGRVHLTGTLTGDATLVGDNGVTYTGHFTEWFGENENRQNVAVTATFSVTLKGDDGSRLKLHLVGHFSSTGAGERLLEFEKGHCK